MAKTTKTSEMYGTRDASRLSKKHLEELADAVDGVVEEVPFFGCNKNVLFAYRVFPSIDMQKIDFLESIERYGLEVQNSNRKYI